MALPNRLEPLDRLLKPKKSFSRSRSLRKEFDSTPDEIFRAYSQNLVALDLGSVARMKIRELSRWPDGIGRVRYCS